MSSAGGGGSSAAADDVAPDDFAHEWISGLLAAVDASIDGERRADIMRRCADVHYRRAGMGEIAREYRGRLEAFLTLLSEKWGWIVTVDGTGRSIIADENKASCVCPLVANGSALISPTLCHCSEGFAARMFSEVTGGRVHATVTSSILRGDPTCKYAIEIEE